MWRAVKNFNPNLLLVHARQASLGEPGANINNHPFVSSDWSLGLVHNGRITEYEELRLKYEVLSQCDSEVLLRMIDADADRLNGIQTVLSHVRSGHMAVAVGEKAANGVKDLFLFRNQHRTLWLFDLRDAIGQVFFCSTPEIWLEAVAGCNLSRRFLSSEKMVDLSPDEVWHLQITPPHLDIRRYRACYTSDATIHQEQWVPIRRGFPKGKCLSLLCRRTPEPAPPPGASTLQDCEELERMVAELKYLVSSGVHNDEEVEYVLVQAKSIIKDCLKTVQAHCK